MVLVLYRQHAFDQGVPFERCCFPVSLAEHYPYVLTGTRRVYHRPACASSTV